MPMSRDKPFPLAVVRDLLGIVRALYRAERLATPPDRRTLEALEQIGQELRMALDLGKNQPGSMGYRAAWSWSEQATAKLGALVADLLIAPAVKATAAKLRRD
jgi:hypothetical protein